MLSPSVSCISVSTEGSRFVPHSVSLPSNRQNPWRLSYEMHQQDLCALHHISQRNFLFDPLQWKIGEAAIAVNPNPKHLLILKPLFSGFSSTTALAMFPTVVWSIRICGQPVGHGHHLSLGYCSASAFTNCDMHPFGATDQICIPEIFKHSTNQEKLGWW